MTGRRGRAAALAVSAAALFGSLAPVSAPASNGPGCTMSWNTPTSGKPSGSGSCVLGFHGMPVQFVGEASAANNGPVSIHVWVTLQGNPEVVIDECRASGSGYVTCGGELSAIVAHGRFPTAPGNIAAALECHVAWKGNRKGSAGCYSKDPCPSLDRYVKPGDPAHSDCLDITVL